MLGGIYLHPFLFFLFALYLLFELGKTISRAHPITRECAQGK
jgi:hypothetical protein